MASITFGLFLAGNDGDSAVARSFTVAGITLLRHLTIKLSRFTNFRRPFYGTSYQKLPTNSRGCRAVTFGIYADDPVSGAPDITKLLAYDDILFDALGGQEESINQRYGVDWPPTAVGVMLNDDILLFPGVTYWAVMNIPGTAYDLYYWPCVGTSYELGSGWKVLTYNEATSSWNTFNDMQMFLDLNLGAQAGITHHVVIDGKGFMTPDLARGQTYQWAAPYQPRVSSGGSPEFSDLEYPYAALGQKTWHHGAGAQDFEDQARYHDGDGIDSRYRNQLTLALRPTWTKAGTWPPYYWGTTGSYLCARHCPSSDSPSWADVIAAGKYYLAVQFTTPADPNPYPIYELAMELRQDVAASLMYGDYYMELWSDNANVPGAMLKSQKVSLSENIFGSCSDTEVSAMLKPVNTVFAAAYNGAINTKYWMVLHWAGLTPVAAAKPLFYTHDTAKKGGLLVKHSLDGTTWSNLTAGEPLFLVNWKHKPEFDGANIGGFCAFNNALYCSSGAKVYKLDAGSLTWSTVYTGGSAVQALFTFAGVLFATHGYGAAAYATLDGTNWYTFNNLPGYGMTSQNIRCMGTGRGYVWAATAANAVKKWNGTTGTDWSAAVTVGHTDADIQSIVLFQGVVHVLKRNGCWYLDDENDLAYLKFSYPYHDANGWAGIEWNRELYYRYFGQIMRFSGAIEDRIDLGKQGDFVPPDRIGWLTGAAGTGEYLFCAFDASGDYGLRGSVWAYDGVGWHQLYAGIPNAHFLGLGISSDLTGLPGLRVWFGEGKQVGYIRLPTYFINPLDCPWDIEGFVSTGWMSTPFLDMNLPQVEKLFREVRVVAEKMTQDTYIYVFYALNGDDTTWTKLGEIDSEGATVLPLDNVIGKTIALKFQLLSTKPTHISATEYGQTPVLKSWALKYLLRPDPTWSGVLRLLLADNLLLMDGTKETRSATDQWHDLMVAAYKKEPVVFFRPWASQRAIITNMGLEIISYKPSEQGDERGTEERQATLSLIYLDV